MQEWEDPLASISISDFCSNWGTTSQPSDCRDSYTGYIQTLSCVCVLFFLWGFVVNFVFFFSPLNKTVIPRRKFSRRLADAKLPQSSDRNRWLLREFSTFILSFLSLLWHTGDPCVDGFIYLLTYRDHQIVLFFSFLPLKLLFFLRAAAAVCHTELKTVSTGLRCSFRKKSFSVPAGFFFLLSSLTVFLWILQQVWCHWSASPRDSSPRRASCWTA